MTSKVVKTRIGCEACRRAVKSKYRAGFYRVRVWLCDRCDKESLSETSKYEVRLSWSDDEMSYCVVRGLREPAEAGSG